jgi:curved DNA-binding protein CbpA
MTQPTHYDTLGVTPGATTEEIRRRYKFLVLAFHPDRFSRNVEHHALAEQRIKQINEAYRVLAEPQSRARYDAARLAGAGVPLHGNPVALTQLQWDLDQARARIQHLERELQLARSSLESTRREKQALQTEMAERERSWREERHTLDAERSLVTLQLEELARERVTFEHLLKDQLTQANHKAQKLSQELATRERLLENITTSKAEWEKSNRSRLDALAQQLQRMQTEISNRDRALSQQKQAQKTLEERLVRVERDSRRNAQNLTDALEAKYNEVESWEASARTIAAAQERSHRVMRLWQLAAVIGIVNTILLLLLLFLR